MSDEPSLYLDGSWGLKAKRTLKMQYKQLLTKSGFQTKVWLVDWDKKKKIT